MRTCRSVFVARFVACNPRYFVLLVLAIAFVPILSIPLDAAPAFAAPVFQALWQDGEGDHDELLGVPLNPTSVRHEAYNGSPGDMRLVQYFDKGRMELNRPSTPVASSGLLTVELLRGQIQTGDATFEIMAPRISPLRGTRRISGRPSRCFSSGRRHCSRPAREDRRPDDACGETAGGTGTYSQGADYPKAAIGAYDGATGHNVAAAFATFRAQVGVSMTGLAVSEPFWSTFEVGGAGGMS